MIGNFTFNNLYKFLLRNTAGISAFKFAISNWNINVIFFLFIIFLFSGSVQSQCSNYYVYEGIGTSIPTGGGTWADNSASYGPIAVVPPALSGRNAVIFNAVGDYLQTPIIATPGIFAFSFKRDGTLTGTPQLTIETSPNNVTWTSRGTIAAGTTNWAAYSINLAALSLTNIYIRIRDTRVSGIAERYLDDIRWSSTDTTLNIIIPGIDSVSATNSCAQTITCGTIYTYSDEGGTSDGNVFNKDNTITFTPSLGTSKVQLVFSSFDTESGKDGMVIYNGPTTGSPIISSVLAAGINAVNCPAGSYYGTTSPGTITSTDASGAITIRFRSDNASSANTGWLATVNCVIPAACQAPTLIATTAITTTSATINWSAPSPAPSNGYQYVVSSSNTPPAGAGTAELTTSANVNSLTNSSAYYVFVRSDCGGSGFSSWTTAGSFTTLTPCIAPAAQASAFALGTATSTTLPASFTGSASGYLVIQSTSATPPTQPVDGTTYSAANVASLGSGLTFIQSSTAASIPGTGLLGNTRYYNYVFAYNNTSCSTGPAYNTSGPLTGNGVTCPAIPNTITTASINGGGFTLNWTAPTGGSASLISYTVQVTTDAAYTANIVGSPFSVAAPTATMNFTGLSPLTMYYYRIRAGNGCNSVYVTGNATTTNYDDCSTATTLTVNGSSTCTTATLGTTAGATQSQVGCVGTADDDVWFTFTATGNSHIVTVTPNTLSDAVFQVFSGSCGSLISVMCTDVTLGSSTEAGTLTGLTIGNMYYIRVYSYANGASQGSFSICITLPAPPPTNGTCAAATSLTCGTSNLAGTTVGTTNIVHGTACGMSNYGVWYTFIGDGQQTTITSTATGGFDHKMAISSGSCGSFTALACEDVGFTNGAETSTFNTVSGISYYVYIASYQTGGNLTGTFSISRTCAAPAAPPANNLCSTATTLPCGTLNLTGTTVNTNNVVHGTGCTMSNYGVWYTFTGDGNQTTISSTATGGFDHKMSISSGSCGTLLNIACQDAGLSNGAESYTFTSSVGTTYYIYIAYYGATSTTGNFVISRSCTTPPPPMTNDECSGAIALSVNTSCSYSYYTNATATGSAGVPAPGCSSYLGGDVWLSVIVPANGILRVDTQTGVVTDGAMAAYTGSCGSLSLLACDDDSSPNGLMPYLSLTGLTPGQTIYIRFWEYGNDNNGTFGICVTSPVSCTTGPGTGVTTLGCPSVVSGGLSLSGGDPAPINACASSTCVDLEATYLQLGQTTDYTVSSITYAPPYQFGCLQNPISVNVDDVWSPVITLPFNFCFYGTNYNQCLVGSNGVLSFDITGNTPGGTNAWSFSNNIPSTTLFKNTIFGVYHDIDPSKGGEVGYELITLNSGCRALVASWSEVPMFSDNSILYTGMMVLYENTNIVEVYIQKKHIDNNNVAPWNSGNAIVGIQNAAGISGVAAPGRNGLDTNWETTNEAWRFTPSGTSITSIKWYQGAGTSGTMVGTTTAINVCPSSTTTYTAEVSYALCNGLILKETDQTTITIMGGKTWNGSISTAWDNDNNWSPVGKPNGTDCVIIPVTSRNPIISGSGYNGLAGTLSILNGAMLTVNSGNNITVTDWVNVQATGNFQIENNSSLIQINNVSNTGNITYKRDASIRKLDYAYWSSPVANFNVNNISSPIAPGPIYTWNTTVANPNGGQGNWQSAAGQVMQRGVGYIVRGPDTFASTPATLNGIFTGVPYNGSFTVPIARGNDQNTALHYGTNGTQITNFSDNNNLIGNPYPSAIRGSEFLFNNNTKIEGNIKLWTHGAVPAIITSPFYNTFTYNYNVNDYLTFNFTGTSCCPAAASDLFVGAGQGFVVQMVDGPTASDVVTFSNSLRSAGYSNSVFYRTAGPNTNPEIDLERNRIWLDIIDNNGMSDRTLIGYIENATMGRDSYFDAGALISTSMSLFSQIGSEKFNIQGRALPFNQDDVVPLSVIIPADGSYKIGIGAVDGLFENPSQDIYLEDRSLGIFHNLRQQPYSFFTSTAVYDNRFFLRYGNNALGINNLGAILDVSAYINNQTFFAIAPQNIESIELFEISGKIIKTYTLKEKNREFMADFNFPNGVYFAKIKLENGFVFTKKLMN